MYKIILLLLIATGGFGQASRGHIKVTPAFGAYQRIWPISAYADSLFNSFYFKSDDKVGVNQIVIGSSSGTLTSSSTFSYTNVSSIGDLFLNANSGNSITFKNGSHGNIDGTSSDLEIQHNSILGLSGGGFLTNISANGLFIGSYSTPATAYLDIFAGTSSLGQIRLRNSALITSTLTGSIEYAGNNWFFTNNKGRAILATTSTTLVSGRLPFVTTDGRITDASTGLFDGSTMTVPIIAHTGTLIGFFNKSPIIQQTSAITSGTYSSVGGSNVSSNDTFGGYTVGQLVAILKAYGLIP